MTNPAKKFQAATKKNDGSVFDFDAEVAQVWRDFPEIKNKVIFLDASHDARLVYPEEGAEKDAIERFLKIYNPKRRLKSAFARWGEKNSFCQPLSGNTRLLYILMEKHPYDKISPRAPLVQETAFVFDHELGHAIIPGADVPTNRAECFADAYATIRHLQRFGADSPFIGHVVNNRSFDLVFRDSWYGHAHFTGAVTEKILDRCHDIDWNALTPREAADLARKFVLEHEMASEALNMLERDFKALHKQAEKIARGDTAPLKELAEKVLSTDSSDVFKYGTKALALYVDRQTADLVLQGTYWNEVRKKLAKRRKAFARYGAPSLRKMLMKKTMHPFKGQI